MLFLECGQQCTVKTREIKGIDNAHREPLFLQEICRCACKGGEVADTDQRGLCALCHNDGLIECAVVRAYRIGTFIVARKRHTDHDWMHALCNGPAQYGDVLGDAGGREIDEVWDVGKDGDVVKAKMRHIGTAVERCTCSKKDGGTAVDGDILRHLVIGALKECAVCAEDRTRSAAGKTGRHCNGVLLGDAHIDVLRPKCGTVGGTEPDAADNPRREVDEVWIFACRLPHKGDGCRGVGIGCGRRFGCTRLDMKGAVAVPAFGIFLGKAQPFSLLCNDVDNDGPLCILYC